MEKPSPLLAVSVVLLMGAIAVFFPFPLRILLFTQETVKSADELAVKLRGGTSAMP